MRLRLVTAPLAALVAACALAGCGPDASPGVPGPTPTTAPAGQPLTAPAVAPYLHLGWGVPTDPVDVMAKTGLRRVTLTFVQAAKGACVPEWDAQRPLLGGNDEKVIAAVRAAGGDVVAASGGTGPDRLEKVCTSANALTAAYEQVVDAYKLTALDVDVEYDLFSDQAARDRIVDALAALKQARPALNISVTFPGQKEGINTAMVDHGAAVSLDAVWTVSVVISDDPDSDVGDLAVQSADALNAALVAAYGYSPEEAGWHSGITTITGQYNPAGATVTTDDILQIAAYGHQHQLGRLSFYNVNRDRDCSGYTDKPAAEQMESCSGVKQAPFAFTTALASYKLSSPAG